MRLRQLFLWCLLAVLTAAQAQKVTTDKRFARGATMAFGRMTTAGLPATEIAEQGFCYAEHSQPTVDDQKSKKYLTNSGRIYWIDGLTPATKYYMRAYVQKNDGQVYYGDVLKFYTLPKGQITYTIRDGGSTDVKNRITNAVKTAIDWWNNLTEMKGFSPNVGYEGGVQTADCSYGGWIRVGPNASYQRAGTIMHEMLHGCGVIPWADTEWSRHNLRSGVNGEGYGTGYWLGDRVTEVLRFLENSRTEQLNGDYQHLWPYGINGAHEDDGTDLLYIGNSLICQALGEDGLQHTNKLFAEPYYAFDQEDDVKYYIKCESMDHGLVSAYLMPTAAGTLEWRQLSTNDAMVNDSAAWNITFTPENQYYQLRNVGTGRYMTYAKSGKNGITTAAHETPSASDNFHLMKSRIDVSVGTTTIPRRGYWLIHPTQNWTPPCLTASADGSISTSTFNIANKSTAQRWLILTKEEAQTIETAAVDELKMLAQEAVDQAKTLFAVPHTEDVPGTDAAFETELARIDELLATATEENELKPLADAAKTAYMTFLQNATPSDMSKPFDLTFLLADPDMETGDGWSQSPSVGFSCGEFYEKAFDMNQTIKNLPGGTYAFCVQGFQRPGKSDACSKNSVTAYVYAGSKKEKMAHAVSGAQTSKLGGTESAVNGKYIPNDMETASIYFAKGLYENRAFAGLSKDGSQLKVGLSCSSMPEGYWVIFSNFRLYFYGSKLVKEVTGIRATLTERGEMFQDKWYDLQGRHVDPSLRKKGIYIRNGKKVVIK